MRNYIRKGMVQVVLRLEENVINKIERALAITLYPSQIEYILNGDADFEPGRATGKTTAHMIRLALAVKSEPIDLTKPESFADYPGPHVNHIQYARSFYRHEFLKIYYMLKDIGLPVRKLKRREGIH